jgi:porphobilinogen deaminase
MSKLVLATRKSPLALAQTEMVAAHLRAQLGVETELLKIVTTGDRQTEWSLEKRGGKGLFTSELEAALLRGEADVAVHSTKDLPGDNPAGWPSGATCRGPTRAMCWCCAVVSTCRSCWRPAVRGGACRRS